jgi:hypothetical protein
VANSELDLVLLDFGLRHQFVLLLTLINCCNMHLIRTSNDSVMVHIYVFLSTSLLVILDFDKGDRDMKNQLKSLCGVTLVMRFSSD